MLNNFLKLQDIDDLHCLSKIWKRHFTRRSFSRKKIVCFNVTWQRCQRSWKWQYFYILQVIDKVWRLDRGCRRSISWLRFHILLIRSRWWMKTGSIGGGQLWIRQAILSVFLGFFLFLYILAHIITPVIEHGQKAKEKSNNWKTLLIAGIFRDFLLLI